MRYFKIRFTEWRDAATEPASGAATHHRVGTFGYQEISDDSGAVAIVDEAGAPLPAGAVVGYEIIDQDPPAPNFGVTAHAMRDGAARTDREIERLAKTDPLHALLKKANLA